jgi:histidine triad (HIT) family protein
MSECIFCKIVEGSIPSHKVFEDAHTYAFLDIFPANRGHTLVIPKKHCKDIFEADHATYSKLEPEGVTIFQMNREAGWQSVFHLHMHVIPRWNQDQLHKPWDIAAATDSDLSQVMEQLAK